MRIRLGTRRSVLARTQSRTVADALERRGHSVEIVFLTTEGDRDQARPYAEVGAPGLFVRTLERALVAREIDLAVHSYKDLPGAEADDVEVVATPVRADPRDRLLVARSGLAENASDAQFPLVPGARIGTASARRIALLSDLAPRAETAFLRGNVDTRLARLVAGDFDAIVLAAAGLDRLQAAGALTIPADITAIDLSPERFPPAPSQGALALQTRSDDAQTRAAVEPLNDPRTARAVAAERRLLQLVEAGCQAPFGAHAEVSPVDDAITLHAAWERAGTLARATCTGADPRAVADDAFESLGGAP